MTVRVQIPPLSPYNIWGCDEIGIIIDLHSIFAGSYPASSTKTLRLLRKIFLDKVKEV